MLFFNYNHCVVTLKLLLSPFLMLYVTSIYFRKLFLLVCFQKTAYLTPAHTLNDYITDSIN